MDSSENANKLQNMILAVRKCKKGKLFFRNEIDAHVELEIFIHPNIMALIVLLWEGTSTWTV